MFHQMQNKLQNMVSIGDDEERLQVASFRSRKRMFTIFISRTDVELIDVLQEGQHINTTYYRDFILDPLVKTLRQRQGSCRIVVHHDIASSRTALSVQQFLQSTNVIVALHPPYSPDLAPLDFWVFPKIKEELAGVSFSRAQDLARAVNTSFRGFQKWIQRLQKCIELKGEYIEGTRK